MFKADVWTRKAGPTETIQGIRAEEFEVVVSLNMSAPLPDAGFRPAVRMTTQVWQASADQVAWTPVLAGSPATTRRPMA
jgi:hypothetical protein